MPQAAEIQPIHCGQQGSGLEGKVKGQVPENHFTAEIAECATHNECAAPLLRNLCVLSGDLALLCRESC